MASSTSSSRTETPATEPSRTPEYSESQTETGPALEFRTGLDNPQVPKVPTRLKLNLPKISRESTSEPSQPRRSLRAHKAPKKHDDTSAGSEATLRRKKANGKKESNPKLLEPLDMSEAPVGAKKASIPAVREGFHLGSQGSTLLLGNSESAVKVNPGGVRDPIDVDALPSPPPPHRFLHRHYNHHNPMLPPSWHNAPPTLLTPNGAKILAGKVSGHGSHDVHKGYIDRKNAPAPPGFADNCTKLSADILGGKAPSVRFLPSAIRRSESVSRNGHRGSLVAVPQYAMPLRMQHQGQFHDHRANARLNPTTVNSYPIYPSVNEEHLRQRAVQLVLDNTRPRPRKRRLADDPDETSSSEYEVEELDPKNETTTPPSSLHRPTTPLQPVEAEDVSTPNTGVSEEAIYDRNLKLAEMVEHTQLLTAMLMIYSRSGDQRDLRDDIAMLARVTNKQLSNWVSAEEKFELETQQRLRLAQTLSPNVTESSNGLGDEEMARIVAIATQAAETQKKQQDDEVRRYLYAGSDVRDEGDSTKSTLRDT